MTKIALSSDHTPIIITINTKTNFRLTQHRRSFTNYNKADWNRFTQEIEDTIAQTAPTSNTHIANKILTNAILNADKHHIPKRQTTNNNLTATRTNKRQNMQKRPPQTTKPKRQKHQNNQ